MYIQKVRFEKVRCLGSFQDRNSLGSKSAVEFVKCILEEQKEYLTSSTIMRKPKRFNKIEVVEETVLERHVYGRGFIIDLEVSVIEYDLK